MSAVRAAAPPLPAWLERMLPFERYLVRVDGVALHVMEHGPASGRPALLLHGNPAWGFLWRKVAAALDGSGMRLIMPDLVGLGLSDKPDAAWHSIDGHGAAIAGLVEALGLEDVLLGVADWGGAIGLRAFCDPPRRDKLGALLLLNTVVGPPRVGFRSKGFHRFARLPLLSDVVFRGLGFPQNVMWAVQGDRASIRGDVARAYRWPLRRLADRVAPLALARMVPDSQEHPSIPALARCQELVESFRGPTEVVWGERDPVLGRVVSHIARLLPAARVTRTAAGHFLQEEVPEEIAAAMRRLEH